LFRIISIDYIKGVADIMMITVISYNLILTCEYPLCTETKTYSSDISFDKAKKLAIKDRWIIQKNHIYCKRHRHRENNNLDT